MTINDAQDGTKTLDPAAQLAALKAARAAAAKVADAVTWTTEGGSNLTTSDGSPVRSVAYDQLAEAARKWIHDQQHPAEATTARPAIALAANHGGTEKDVDQRNAKDDIRAALDVLEDFLNEARASNNDVLVSKLERIIKNLSTAKDPKAALAEAKNTIRSLGGSAKDDKAETPTQKVERLWGEIDKLDKEIKEKSSKLDHLKTPEDKQQEQKLQIAKAEARDAWNKIWKDHNKTAEEKATALQSYLKAIGADNQFQQDFAQRIIDDPTATKEDKAAALSLLDNIQQQQKNLTLLNIEEAAKKDEKLNSIRKTTGARSQAELANTIAKTAVSKENVSLSLDDIDNTASQAKTDAVDKLNLVVSQTSTSELGALPVVGNHHQRNDTIQQTRDI